MLEVRQTSTVMFLATIRSARSGRDLTVTACPSRLVFSLLTAQARFSTEPNLSGHSPAWRVRGTERRAASLTPPAMGAWSEARLLMRLMPGCG